MVREYLAGLGLVVVATVIAIVIVVVLTSLSVVKDMVPVFVVTFFMVLGIVWLTQWFVNRISSEI